MSKSVTHRGRWIAIAMAIGLFWPVQGLGAKPAPYTLVTLDNRDGSVRGLVLDVTIVVDTITCVGYLAEVDGDQAVLWRVTPSGSGFTVSQSYLPGGEGALALNADGEVVGTRTAFDADAQVPVVQGLYWPHPSGPPILLAPLDGGNETEALGINSAGVIVGRSTRVYETTDAEGHVARHWEPTAVAWRTDILDYKGDLVPFALADQPAAFSGAHDINERDEAGIAQVVGMSVAGRPVLWQLDCDTLMSIGPAVLVPEDVAAGGMAEGINGAGDICGRYDMRAFRRLAGGTFAPLSTPRNGTSIANDINGQRQVVGRVWEWNRTGGLSKTYGVMWRADGKLLELNSFLGRSGWRHVHEGKAITSGGIIAATGVLDADGESRALLMIPE